MINRRGFRSAALLFLLWASVFASIAQSAKELHDQGMSPSIDQCSGLKLVCKAATMDKKYKGDCENFIVSITVSSNRNLNTGYEKLDQKLYPSAARYANNVCEYDSAMSDKKQKLLKAIRDAQPIVDPPLPPTSPPDPSPAKLQEAESRFSSGDFDGAGAAARQVTNSSLQPSANRILQAVTSYKNAIQDGRQKESSDPQGAIQSYRSALSISSKDAGELNSRIKDLESRIIAKVPVEPPPPHHTDEPPVKVNPPIKPTPLPVPASADLPTQVANLLRDAKMTEPHNVREALNKCQSAARLIPANAEANACITRLQIIINSDPAEQAKVLADAIRAFYGANYSDAEDDLTSYLSSPTAKYKGAASFYFGASRLYHDILETSGKKPQDAINSASVQKYFKEARKDCYQPVAKYLAPVVLSAWNVSAANPACSR